jgi:hypothetical protein
MRVRVTLRDKTRVMAGDRQPLQVGMEVPWRSEVESWPEDLRADFEERAAIMEFDGGLSRLMAERRAYQIIRSVEDVARLIRSGDA